MSTAAKSLRNYFAALPAGGTLPISQSVLNSDLSGSRFAVLVSTDMTYVCETRAVLGCARDDKIARRSDLWLRSRVVGEFLQGFPLRCRGESPDLLDWQSPRS